jgi:hypothetical protein
MIVNRQSNSLVAGTEHTGRPHMSLDDLEAWLTRGEA